jgi:hypothetical protein
MHEHSFPTRRSSDLTNSVPAQISLRNFDIHATRAIHLTNTILFVSKLYTTASNLQVFDGGPGPQEPYFPVTGGSYTLTNVLCMLKGTASYTGVASGTEDLGSTKPQNLASASGTWQILNGTNRAHLDFTFAFAEITVSNALGTIKINISGAGSLNAQSPVNAPPPPAPTLAGSLTTNQFTIRWPSSLWPTAAATSTPAGYWLYRTTDLTAPAGWEREPATVNDDGTWSTVDVPVDATQRFYRLDWK